MIYLDDLVHLGLITQEQADAYHEKMKAEWDDYFTRRSEFSKQWWSDWRTSTPWWRRWVSLGLPPDDGAAWKEYESRADD